ncbi:hypothetical protein DYBT9623_00584 [Dyadobacter sp. CECT 9623]|uniref:DUF72 domain-containing protein n=1 Tax=Dyadobacter linearis TaxID=2823330 RepID=A0ABM8UK30_9BACT|nr:DUF72 domain-containing protein [Dyadobacter sp. CECT 9623]CAG5067857.1 hypothetical protein DYBT9623_00584 [Dyadobacter sp. CECT 9623]
MIETQAGKFFTGTSGLVFPVPNKQFYPPEYQDKSRLTYYGSLFNSIEINSSFYKVPLASTVRNWATQVPENFTFTFKLWREITHNKGLVFDPEYVKKFMEVIGQIGEKKGCLLVQFPPSLKAILRPQLERLLTTISESDPDKSWKVALEFRHSSWYEDEIFETLDEFGFEIVRHDKPGSAPGTLESESDYIYLRFHGPNGDYKGQYEDDMLIEYAEHIQDWLDAGKTVFAYFNNTMGEAMKNLTLLNSVVKSGRED